MTVTETALVDPITRGIRATSGATGLVEHLPRLRLAVEEYDSLGREAGDALGRREPDKREQLLQDRACKIVSLADELVPVLNAKVTPATISVAERLQTLKGMAEEALRESTPPTHFPLASLLTHMGSTVHYPNDL
jgi:hypothetical protein